MVQPSPARLPAPVPTVVRRSTRWGRVAAAIAVSAAAALVTGAGGCAEPVPFHENQVGVLPQNSLSRAWFVDLNLAGDEVVTVDVRRETLYAYTAHKRVTAIDRKSGVVKFTMAVASPESRLQPLVELDKMIVFPNATSLQVYDSTDGTFLKSVPVPTPLRSNAAAESSEAPGTNRGTTVYFGATGIGNGGLVEAYDISRRTAFKKWEFITHDQGAILAAPAVYGDIVYTGDDRGEVDAVSAARVQVWDTDKGIFQTAGSITADLRADDTGLYVASGDTKLYCLNRATGKLKWQYFAGAPLASSPTLTPDTVYLLVGGRGLVALDKNAGQFNRAPRWTSPTATQFLAQDARYAYVAESRSNPANPDLPPVNLVVALDKQTGRRAFESDHKDFTVFGTNPRDGLIYAGFAGGKLIALQPVLHAGQIGELVLAPVPPARTSVASAG